MTKQEYIPRFYTFLKEQNLKAEELPFEISDIIKKFELAQMALRNSPETKTTKYDNVLIQTDAVICAKIFSLSQNKMETVNVDKLKLLALKAKALKLKMKLNK